MNNVEPAITAKEWTQLDTLSYAMALGWIKSDDAESLDHLEHDAKRWLARWGQDALERMGVA